MLNIFSYKGNANKNHTEHPSHLSQNDCHQENKQQMLVRMQGKRDSYTLLERM
jgi:hypothetical protein